SPLVQQDPLSHRPARELLEEDNVTLRCRRWWNLWLTQMRFYHEGKDLGGSLQRSELSLPPLQLQHRGRYRCGGRVGSKSSAWEESAPVTVTVHGEHPHTLI
ncbi:FCGR3 protein, partial [Onychorhynchus coronatus]|nr:FCGR3 protein [Onychorhynchus coronatus]